jgi:hypothetical protein
MTIIARRAAAIATLSIFVWTFPGTLAWSQPQPWTKDQMTGRKPDPNGRRNSKSPHVGIPIKRTGGSHGTSHR